MNVVITGATGFLGRYLIQTIEQNDQISKAYCIVRNPSAFPREGYTKCIAVHCDLETIDTLENISADVCIHLAGVSDELVANREEFFRTNVRGTEDVITFCQKNNIPKIVFISSVHVYLPAKSVYASSKRAAENAIVHSGLNYVILRSATIYGPGCKSIDTIANWIRNYHVIPILKKGKAIEQPVFIRDAADRILACAVTESENCILDLYGKTAMSYKTMVQTIAAVLGERIHFLHLPLAPTKLAVHLLQSLHLKTPVSIEQIAHMCADLQTTDPHFQYDSDEFRRNLSGYLIASKQE